MASAGQPPFVPKFSGIGHQSFQTSWRKTMIPIVCKDEGHLQITWPVGDCGNRAFEEPYADARLKKNDEKREEVEGC